MKAQDHPRPQGQSQILESKIDPQPKPPNQVNDRVELAVPVYGGATVPIQTGTETPERNGSGLWGPTPRSGPAGPLRLHMEQARGIQTAYLGAARSPLR